MVTKVPYAGLADFSEDYLEDLATSKFSSIEARQRDEVQLKRVRGVHSEDKLIEAYITSDSEDIPIGGAKEPFDQPYYCVTSNYEESMEEAEELAEDLESEFPNVELYLFQRSH